MLSAGQTNRFAPVGRITAAILLSFALLSCSQSITHSDEALQTELTEIVESFFQAYEPQMQSADEAFAMSVAPFTQANDFSMVIDGRALQGFRDRNPSAMVGVYEGTASASHPITETRFSRLSDTSAVMTVYYRTDFTESSGREGSQNAVVTAVFRQEATGWKIVQYNGVHGEEVYTTQEDNTEDISDDQ